MNQRKGKTIFSAVQPTGNITIGNYFGAVKNWVQLQSDFNCIFALADLHAITVRRDPEEFKRKTLESYALLLACGIDMKKKFVFYPKPSEYTLPTGMDVILLHWVWRLSTNDAI